MSTTPNVNTAHRAWIEVDLPAIVRNARAAARQTRAPIMPMVKADAYGLGVGPVVRALEAVDPWGYGVATTTEGEELRTNRIHRPIVITAPVESSAASFGAVRAARLIPSLGDSRAIRMWMMTGGGDWHLAIDTGMSRLGIRFDEVGTLADELRACPPAGAFTHFHSSQRDDGSMELQTRRFRDAVAAMPGEPAVLHVENSGAIARTSRSPWSVSRPGVFLYGVGSGAVLVPEQVVHFHAQVVALRGIRPGDTVSYDATWVAKRPTRIATLSVGYADGYRRSLSNRGVVRIGDNRVPVVGTVTMDLTMVDVTDVPCEIGDIATLIGGDGDDAIRLEEVGAACGLSPYEILTGLRARAPRLYT